MSTYFKFGSYQHDDNEVNVVSLHKFRSRKRGLQHIEVRRLQIYGELKLEGLTQSQAIAKIQALENAYAADGFDAGLYYSDDTVTHNFLDTGSSIDGVHVVNFVFPKGDGSELVAQRSYSIVLQGEYFQTTGSQLIEWVDRLTMVGNGGPRRRVIEFQTGVTEQIVSAATPGRAIQTGYAIADEAYILPADPIFPAFLLNDSATVGRTSGEVQQNNVLKYRTSWNYRYASTGSLQGGVPITR